MRGAIAPAYGLGSCCPAADRAIAVWSPSSADTPLAFAAMALLSVMSVLLFYGVALPERLLLP